MFSFLINQTRYVFEIILIIILARVKYLYLIITLKEYGYTFNEIKIILSNKNISTYYFILKTTFCFIRLVI